MEYPFSNGWLISVGQVSSRSITLLQMTTFSSFTKPNNSLWSVPNVFSLCAHLRWTWGLFPHRGCCKECRSEQELGSVLPHWGSGCYFGWTPEVWPTDWLSDSSIGFLFNPPTPVIHSYLKPPLCSSAYFFVSLTFITVLSVSLTAQAMLFRMFAKRSIVIWI